MATAIAVEGKICKSSKGEAIETRMCNTRNGQQFMTYFRLSVYQGKKSDGSGDYCMYKCVIFGTLAENAHRHLKAGDMVVVAGDLKIDNWTAQNGEARITPSIMVQSIGVAINRFNTPKNDWQPQGGYAQPQNAPQSPRSEIYPEEVTPAFSQYGSGNVNTDTCPEIPF